MKCLAGFFLYRLFLINKFLMDNINKLKKNTVQFDLTYAYIVSGDLAWFMVLNPLNAKTFIVYNVTLPYIPKRNDKTSPHVACHRR
jgi:hypothetical protein